MKAKFTIPNTDFEVLNEAVNCPHCDTMIVPNLLNAIKIKSYPHNRIVAMASCIDQTCELPFLLEYKQTYKYRDENWEKKPFVLQGTYNYDYEANIPDDLEAFRDDEKRPYLNPFFQIYEQAHQANESGLSEISGGGYRKALEFLTKDYANYRFPNEKTQVSKEPLVQVIKRFTENVTLQTVASRAAWLGNDHLHYYKTWDTKDIEDMIQLIHSTVYWICQTEMAKELLLSMPDPKNPKK